MTPFVYILGLPNFANYEATAALIRVPRGGGAIEYVTTAEERFSRVKHAYAFPLRGIHHCLQAFGLESLDEVDYIYTDYARLPRWLNSGPGYRKLEHDYLKLRLNYPRERIRIVDHHDGHAASAFYPSPFDEAAVLVVDGLGSRSNVQTLYHFTRAGGAKEIERGDYWGIGRLYALVTGAVLPYGPEKGYGKTMGLAPYGRSHPGPVLRFDSGDTGMTTDYSAFSTRAPLPRVVAPGVRKCEDRESALDPYFARAAYDVQQECERQMVRMARYAHERTGARHLCIAGGVGLNGLSNARILQEAPLDDVWITPGCSDTGLPLGVALWGYFEEISHARAGNGRAGADRQRVGHAGADRQRVGRVGADLQVGPRPKTSVSMPTAYTGRAYPSAEITALLERYGITHEAAEPERVADLIADGNVVGWYQGGSEFGPRALGHRSILADPRNPDMKDILNRRVKFREPYRPYAPSILEEHAAEWLHLDRPSPFMLLVVEVREDKRPLIPAVTHVDHTTRPQTVTKAANPEYYRMIGEFHRLTGVPMVLNTSLNINREPIVETPIDALICAFGTAIDYLYLDGRLIRCQPYARPELVQQLTADRATVLDEEWAAITSRYLTRYDKAERDGFLAEANRIAEWHREYRAKYELEKKILEWRAAGASIVIVGTRGHTRCLHDYIDGFDQLKVRAFVPLDDRPGERAAFSAYPECVVSGFSRTTAAAPAVDWTGVAAVLVSTHEYQGAVLGELRSSAPAAVDIFTMYDDAGDSLLHVLPGRWPARNPMNVGRAFTARRSAIDIGRPFTGRRATVADIESEPTPSGVAERYALVVRYGSVAADALDRQLKALMQNFVCTTIGELVNPLAPLPESGAVITFDCGLRGQMDDVLPILARWRVPATIYCPWPLTGVIAADDLRRWQDAGLEIGILSRHYMVYTLASQDDQRRDLQAAAEHFQGTFGVRALHWAHAYGPDGACDLTPRRVLQEVGFSSGVTRTPAIVKPSDLRAPFELPRFDAADVFDESGNLLPDKLHALFVAD
jgi:carbamoyltransferase